MSKELLNLTMEYSMASCAGASYEGQLKKWVKKRQDAQYRDCSRKQASLKLSGFWRKTYTESDRKATVYKLIILKCTRQGLHWRADLGLARALSVPNSLLSSSTSSSGTGMYFASRRVISKAELRGGFCESTWLWNATADTVIGLLAKKGRFLTLDYIRVIAGFMVSPATLSPFTPKHKVHQGYKSFAAGAKSNTMMIPFILNGNKLP
jgi:hypothetical protein